MNKVSKIFMKCLGVGLIFIDIVQINFRAFNIIQSRYDWEFPYWHLDLHIIFAASFLGIVFGFMWYVKETSIPYSQDIQSIVQFLIRAHLAYVIMSYGMDKILDDQFNVPENQKDIPLIDVNPFTLTWYYMGYSYGYMLFIAMAEFGGGLLLLFRKTKLVGALIVFGTILNIVLIDYFFSINREALIVATMLLVASIYLILLDFDRIKSLFLPSSNPENPEFNISNFLKYAVILGVISGAIFIRNLIPDDWENNTFLKGVYEVSNIDSNNPVLLDHGFGTVLTKIYFEYYSTDHALFEHGNYRQQYPVSYQLDSINNTLTLKIDNTELEFIYRAIEPQLFRLERMTPTDSTTFEIFRIRESTK